MFVSGSAKIFINAGLVGVRAMASAKRLLNAVLILSIFACTNFMQTAPAFAKRGYSALVIDRNTGKTLYSKNADTARFPASLTKMMTLYVVFDLIESGRISYKTKLRVTKKAASQQPSKLGLKAGSKIGVRDAVRALVTKSANDVAVTIAENLAGTEAKFARIMTWKARQIGMKHTTFRNASGLPHSQQLTTARDMAILGERLMSDFPKHYKVFRTRYFAYNGRSYSNHNSLLRNYTGTDGIKTGYTRASGFNLVASVKRGKKHLIGVVLGGKTSRKRNASMRSMLTRSFKKASTVRTRTARKGKGRVRIPTPMIANLQPNNETPQSRSQYRASSTRTSLRAPTPKPVLRRPKVTQPVKLGRVRKIRKSVDTLGPYQIQVGAFDTKREAELRILEVSHRFSDDLRSYRALTMPFNLNNEKLYFRARFAGFTNKRAAHMCDRVRAADLACIVVRAK